MPNTCTAGKIVPRARAPSLGLPAGRKNNKRRFEVCAAAALALSRAHAAVPESWVLFSEATSDGRGGIATEQPTTPEFYIHDGVHFPPPS